MENGVNGREENDGEMQMLLFVVPYITYVRDTNVPLRKAGCQTEVHM
jgi:hypothetical protein